MDNSKNYKVAIIILNYKTPHLVIDCLHSIETEISENEFYVAIVDNKSDDDSVSVISDAIKNNGWEQWAGLIQSNINGGFSSGNNIGISSVSAEYYLLLNSDTLVTDGAIRKLYDFAKDNRDIGIISPNLIWPDNEFQTSSFRNIHPVSELIRTADTGVITKIFNTYKVSCDPCLTITFPDWVCFASVLISNEVIQAVGDLDDKYFMYFEDVDYCRRSLEKGFKIANYPDAKVIHLNGGSSGISSKNKTHTKSLPDYYYASRARYFKKFYGRTGLIYANMLWMMGRVISLIREMLSFKKSRISKNEFRKIWTKHLFT